MKKLLFLFCLFLLSMLIEQSILRATQKREKRGQTQAIPEPDATQSIPTERVDICDGVDCRSCCQGGTATSTRCCRCCNQCQLYSDGGNTECGDLPS